MSLKDIDKSNIPRHVAVIMDGNGRWAKKRGLRRENGHREGRKSVRKIVECCVELGIKNLTLYAFSTENWNRPKLEVDFLMQLLFLSLKVILPGGNHPCLWAAKGVTPHTCPQSSPRGRG